MSHFHISDTLTLLSMALGFFIALLLAVALVWAGWHYLRQASFKATGEVADRQDKTITAMRKQVKNLERMVQMQEKRLNRSEIEAQRKERLLFNARQEIEYFEDILRIVLPIVTRTAPEEKKKADAVLKQLGSFRSRAAKEQLEWEETKDALSIYLETAGNDPCEDDDEDK